MLSHNNVRWASSMTMAEFSIYIALIPIKDVLVNAIGGFLGGLVLLWVAMGTQGIRSLRNRWGRPNLRIERRRTPENIFTGIELGAPAQWVQQQLGAPTRVASRWWGYRYADALVALTFGSDDSLESIAVALTNSKTTFDFPAWHFDCPPLGKITVKNLLEVEHLSLEFNDSLRHSELRFTGREGPTGAWHYIAFGALNPNIPGSLLPAEFEWDKANKALVSRSQDVMINWAAVSSSMDIDGFPWDFALTI